jgi:hypothetical protein
MTVVLASVAFWAPVTFSLPGDDGQLEVIKGRARYKRLKTSERKALDRRIRAARRTPDIRKAMEQRLAESADHYTEAERKEIRADLDAEPITDTEFLAEVLVDWDFRDKVGTPIPPYSPAQRAELCEDWDGFEAALVRGHMDAQEKAANHKELEKNSEGHPGTGT